MEKRENADTFDQKTTRVAVLNPNYLEATGIDQILRAADTDIVSEHFSETKSLLGAVDGKDIDVLLMDTGSLSDKLEQTTRLVMQSFPNIFVVWLSPADGASLTFDAINAHADGCASKHDFGGIIEAVAAARTGDVLYSKEILLDFSRQTSAQYSKAGDQLSLLTTREREILEHLRAGASNKEIARMLDISVETVKIHVKNVKKKLGHSRATN